MKTKEEILKLDEKLDRLYWDLVKRQYISFHDHGDEFWSEIPKDALISDVIKLILDHLGLKIVLRPLADQSPLMLIDKNGRGNKAK